MIDLRRGDFREVLAGEQWDHTIMDGPYGPRTHKASDDIDHSDDSDRIRADIWALAESKPPADAEPKDIVAHMKVRLAAYDRLIKLDALDRRYDEAPVVAEKKTDGRKKALDLLGKVAQHFQRGEET